VPFAVREIQEIRLKRFLCAVALASTAAAIPLCSQTNQPATTAADPTLQINSSAVLVDVLVTDRDGRPVKGLKQDAFTLDEQGKPQTISFFEEHSSIPGPPKEIPKLPPNVFSNFSPFPDPPAVNVLLLDSLNTRMENQSEIHKEALKFLKTAKPGTRMAIFTMGLGLHFIQGFTDDPSLLMAALNNKSNREIELSLIDQSQTESNVNANVLAMMNSTASSAGGVNSSSASSAMISALSRFLDENEASQTISRGMATMGLLQRLATFLNGFPGRKNVIWFSETFPLTIQGNVDPGLKDNFAATMAMLAAARVALYPVDARGVETAAFYQASNQLPSSMSSPSQITGNSGAQVRGLQREDSARAASRYTQEELAKETGGQALIGRNDLAQVIDDITSSSADFYTLSYMPANQKMDGSYRKIDLKVAGGHYNLSYRRGYPAIDAALPGNAMAIRAQRVQKLAAQNPGSVDPLIPFMDLGMPQSQQIHFKVLVKPLPDRPATDASQAPPPQAGAPAPPKGPQKDYKVDFAIDLSDLDLNLDADGLHKGGLSISILAYDRYGNIGSRKETQAVLAMKPEMWEFYQKVGLLFHSEIPIPKGHYWLRIGVFDQNSGKVGTLELPLDSVTTVAQKTP
jgi:VWFA-related protein